MNTVIKPYRVRIERDSITVANIDSDDDPTPELVGDNVRCAFNEVRRRVFDEEQQIWQIVMEKRANLPGSITLQGGERITDLRSGATYRVENLEPNGFNGSQQDDTIAVLRAT